MNDQARKILFEIIQKKGQTFFKNEKEFRALFEDLCHGEYKKERRCIIDSILEGVPDTLLKKFHEIPPELLFAQLTDRLINFGFDPKLARWTVESWALAFGLIDDKFLVTRLSSLTIASNPAGAEVFINDKSVGITPVHVSDLSAAHYVIRVILPGYLPWQDVFNLPQGEKKTIHANLNKEISSGELLIDSSPQGAVIHMDSHYRGETPKKITNISAGNHEIFLTRSGYEKSHRYVTIHAGRNPDIIQTLTAEKTPPGSDISTIAVDSYPSAAKIFLDGKFVGKTPSVLKGYSPGSYHLKLQLSGYSDFSTAANIHPGKNQDIFWRFEHKSSSLRSSLITYSIIAVCAVAILFAFLGFVPISENPSTEPSSTPNPAASINPRSNAVILAEGNITPDTLGGGYVKKFYFEVGNPDRIRFIRVRVDSSSDLDFIVGKDYVPTFNPPHYNQIADIGLYFEEIDISNLEQGTYFIAVRNKGSQSAFTITKTTFYK